MRSKAQVYSLEFAEPLSAPKPKHWPHLKGKICWHPGCPCTATRRLIEAGRELGFFCNRHLAEARRESRFQARLESVKYRAASCTNGGLAASGEAGRPAQDSSCGGPASLHVQKAAQAAGVI